MMNVLAAVRNWLMVMLLVALCHMVIVIYLDERDARAAYPPMQRIPYVQRESNATVATTQTPSLTKSTDSRRALVDFVNDLTPLTPLAPASHNTPSAGESLTFAAVDQILASKKYDDMLRVEFCGSISLGHLVYDLVPSLLRTESWYAAGDVPDNGPDPVYLTGRYRPLTRRFELLYRAMEGTYVVTSFETDGRRVLSRKTKWFRDPPFVPRQMPRRGVLGALRGVFACHVDWNPVLKAAVAELPVVAIPES